MRSTRTIRRRNVRIAALDRSEFEMRIVTDRRTRRLTLRISPDGQELRVTAPPHVNDRQIDEFIVRQHDWIASRLARMPQAILPREGALVPFLGRQHRIVATGETRGKVEAGELGNEPVLRVPGELEQFGRRIRSFLIREARTRLEEAVLRHGRALEVRPRAIRIGDTLSRWGSCSSKRTLSFSWRIVMAPPEILDYLAAHEVAHLRQMDHSPAFWSLVRQLCPQMENHRKWLRRNGGSLHAIKLD